MRERWTVNLAYHSLRPQLEDLEAEEIAKLAVEVTAEARRRALVLGENNDAAANDLVHELQERTGGFEARIVKREWNAQHAERMALAWAARADALMKESPNAPGVPADPGALLDNVIRVADAWLRAGNTLPYSVVGAIREAALARKTPLNVPTESPNVTRWREIQENLRRTYDETAGEGPAAVYDPADNGR